jgi:hypothetical protein
MELTLLPSDHDDVLRVRSSGPVSLRDEDDPLPSLAGAQCYTQKVFLFLDESQSVDTSGICWLTNTSKRFTEERGKLVLVAVPPVVFDVLDFLHLVPLLNIAANEQAAREMIAEPESAPDNGPTT